MTDDAYRRHLEKIYSRDPLQVLQTEHYHAGYFESADVDIPTSQQRYLEVLLQDQSLLPEHCVVDIGCGQGTTARWIHRQFGATVVGVDIVETVLQRGRARDQLALARADMGRLPFRSDCVDAIVGVESVYHHRDRTIVFAEFARVLRPRGVLLLSEYLLGDSPRRLPTNVVSAVVESKFLANEATYRDQLSDAGFVEVSVVDVAELTAIGTADFLRSHAALRHQLFQAELGPRRGKLASIVGYPLLYKLWCSAFKSKRVRQVFLTARLEG